MSSADRIDYLIAAGWYVLESGFDLTAFHNWRRHAFDCVNDLLGPEHPYTEYFRDLVAAEGKRDLLTGEGILTAAKEQLEWNVIAGDTCDSGGVRSTEGRMEIRRTW